MNHVAANHENITDLLLKLSFQWHHFFRVMNNKAIGFIELCLRIISLAYQMIGLANTEFIKMHLLVC